jgi:ABC-2 type transport system permease protein
VQPAIVLAIALSRVDVAWSPAKIALLPLALVSGVFIWGAIWVVTSSLAFWTVETQEVANSFTYGGQTLSHYPIDVLGSWLRRLVVFVVPLAFTSYLPVAYVLDKPRAFGLPRGLAFACPLVAAALVLLARAVWRLAVRHYRSTGS